MAEQVAHTTGSHTYEHLHEVASRHREEGYASLTGHGLGQQGLTRSRRTYEQGTLGNLTAQLGVFLWILQEFHDFLHLLLGTFLSGHVLERDVQVAAFLIHLGFRLAHAEDTATAGTSCSHTAEQVDPEHDEEYPEQVVEDKRRDIACILIVVVEIALELAFGTLLVNEGFYLVNAAELHLHKGIRAHLLRAGLEDFADMLGLHIHLKRVLRLVHHDLRGIAFGNQRLELFVGNLLADRTVLAYRVTTGKIHRNESHEHQDVNPAHVKLRHLRFGVILVLLFHAL